MFVSFSIFSLIAFAFYQWGRSERQRPALACAICPAQSRIDGDIAARANNI